jgi:hypothetical protein
MNRSLTIRSGQRHVQRYLQRLLERVGPGLAPIHGSSADVGVAGGLPLQSKGALAGG